MGDHTASALVAVENSAQRAATTAEDIPDVSHPKWQQLMTDDLNIDKDAEVIHAAGASLNNDAAKSNRSRAKSQDQ
jgi:hypothetical protein